MSLPYFFLQLEVFDLSTTSLSASQLGAKMLPYFRNPLSISCVDVDEALCQGGCMGWQTCQDCIYWCDVTEEETCADAHVAFCSFTNFKLYLQIFISTLGAFTILCLTLYLIFWRSQRIVIMVSPETLVSSSVMCPNCGTVQIMLSHSQFFQCSSRDCSTVLSLNIKNGMSFLSPVDFSANLSETPQASASHSETETDLESYSESDTLLSSDDSSHSDLDWSAESDDIDANINPREVEKKSR